MSHIEDFVSGIAQDLKNVTANEGHEMVTMSILSQTKRLADLARQNHRLRNDCIMEEIKEKALLCSVDVPVGYKDGEKAAEKMVPLAALNIILLNAFGGGIRNDSD